MVAKKMSPPRVIANPLGDDYDEVPLTINFRIQAGQIVMQFSDHIERVRMGSGGARKLAASLTEKAAELEQMKKAAAAPSPASRPRRGRPKAPVPGTQTK